MMLSSHYDLFDTKYAEVLNISFRNKKVSLKLCIAIPFLLVILHSLACNNL